MNRTKIIAADGTEYEAIPARTALRRKIIRRVIAGTALLITALFLSAAIIGLQKAAIAPAKQGPNATDYATLRDAQKANPHSDCFFEWNEVQNAFEVICDAPAHPTASSAISLTTIKKACKIASRGMKQDCYALYLRKAWADPRGSFTPDGKALVKECIDQYRGRELADCFTQEIG